MGIKAVIFARVSSIQQEYDRQISDLMPVVKADGYKGDEIYIIKYKESATKNNFEERQSVQELIDLIEHNPIEVVYTSEVSRLARRSDVMYGILKAVTEKNICLYIQKPQPVRSINPDGTPNPSATIMLAFLQSMAEQESAIKLERLKSGIKQRRAEGRITGKIKFGYDRTDDNKPTPNPVQERELVRKCIKYIDVIPMGKAEYKIVPHYQDVSLDSDVWFHYKVRGWKIYFEYVCDEIIRPMEWTKRI